MAWAGCSGTSRHNATLSSGAKTKLTSNASTTGHGFFRGAITSSRRWLIPIVNMLLITKVGTLENGQLMQIVDHNGCYPAKQEG